MRSAIKGVSLLLLVAILWPRPCVAQASREQAAALLREGNALHDQRDYHGALRKYRQAQALFPSYKMDFNIGATLEAMGARAEAAAHFQRFLSMADEPDMVALARDRLDALARKLAEVTVTCEVVGAAVLVAEEVLGHTPLDQPVYLAPGSHRLRIEAVGYAPFSRVMTLAAGQRVQVSASLLPLSVVSTSITAEASLVDRKKRSVPFYRTWWFWTAVGVAVVGGTVAGAIAASGGQAPGVGPGYLDDIVVK